MAEASSGVKQGRCRELNDTKDVSKERRERRPYKPHEDFGLHLEGNMEPLNGFSLDTDMVKLVF